ncbi:class F sortase [Pseudonocardia oceani]|uniref:class F sortase n=1 Tax=Pseudonocardia oceani TaxID=2792013 RepID=UPI0027E2D020|nr:class F sortase [Pseudonocardia oceani]
MTVTYPPRTSTPAVPTLTPIAVRVPSIAAESSLVATGFNPDGTAEVPPVDQPRQASWFEPGVEPGDVGPAVIYGHVSGRDGGASVPGVFARLAGLGPGDLIETDRSDGVTLRWEVTVVETYDKSRFPSASVYGDTDGPELRLVTCGGRFDAAARSYESNVVAYAVPA